MTCEAPLKDPAWDGERWRLRCSKGAQPQSRWCFHHKWMEQFIARIDWR